MTVHPPEKPLERWIVTTSVMPEFPLGAQSVWVSPAGVPVPVTLLDAANRYLLIAGARQGEDPGLDDDLIDVCRGDLCARAGWPVIDTEPKVGIVVATGDPGSPLRFRVRQGKRDGWHPAMAGSGVVALAAAASTAGTVVADLLGGPVAGTVNIVIPGDGLRTFSVGAEDGCLVVHYPLSPVQTIVHDDVSHDLFDAPPMAARYVGVDGGDALRFAVSPI